jgi:hypothetical protein
MVETPFDELVSDDMVSLLVDRATLWRMGDS